MMVQVGNVLLKIRELILTGVFPAGTCVSENMLVERLGVSRTPVRTALQRLVQEGLIKPPGMNGYEISSFTVDQALDAIAVRATLEGMAARCAAQKGLLKSHAAEFETCLRQLDAVVEQTRIELKDFQTYSRWNERFHALVVARAQNEVLRRSLDGVLVLPFASPSAFVCAQSELPDFHETLRLGHLQHWRLIDAISAGDAETAEALAREHAMAARRNLRLALSNSAAIGHVPGAVLIRREEDSLPCGQPLPDSGIP